MFKKKKQLIGLDIGSHSVKVIELKHGKRGAALAHMGIAPVAPQAILEGVVREPEKIAQTIRNLVNNLNIKDRAVATSISGYAVMIKKIEVPAMSEDELDQSMHQELGQYIPYNIKDVHVDYQILGAAPDRPSNMEVLLVAAKKEAVEDYVKVVNLAGIEVGIVDIDFFALSNAYEMSYGVIPNETVALVDAGANKTSINVLHSGVPVFTRDISLGGAHITLELQNRFGLPFDQAERIKLGESQERISARDVEETVFHAAKTWSTEIKRALDFFNATYRDTKIDRILLSGGSSRLQGFDRLLNKETGLIVEIFNPLKRVDYDAKSFDAEYVDHLGPQMAICLGLAFRKADEK
jgi:type IV pilus assembly protein PilM